MTKKKTTARSTARLTRDSAAPSTIRQPRAPNDTETGEALRVLAEELEVLRDEVKKLRHDLEIVRAIAHNPARSGAYRGFANRE